MGTPCDCVLNWSITCVELQNVKQVASFVLVNVHWLQSSKCTRSCTDISFATILTMKSDLFLVELTHLRLLGVR